MKKSVLIQSLISCLLIAIVSCCSNDKKCIIKGKTVEVENKSIFLFKAGDDIRYGGIEIPVVDNKFEYEISYIYSERYQLVFDISNIPDGVPTFFTKPGEIFLTVYPYDKLEKNTVTGGKLNTEYHDLFINLLEKKPIFDSLEIVLNAQSNINDSLKMLEEEIRIAQDGKERESIKTKIQYLTNSNKDLSHKEEILYKKAQSINQEYFNQQVEYVKKNTSIISYYLLYEILLRHKDEIDLDFLVKCYDNLSKKYPNHPYTELIGNLLNSIKNIHIGGQYIDFPAPDLTGKIIKVSEIIYGKIALIDLWSTWCSPCILTSRSMIPVFNEFKDKGFTIIGVAANKDQNDIQKMVEKENYPWTNLIEVNNQNKIWEKYGIQNWGGSTFLVNRDGKIIAISPSPDEIRNILNETLK
jgi:thiol-disulfide isomerase/thioredoxin